MIPECVFSGFCSDGLVATGVMVATGSQQCGTGAAALNSRHQTHIVVRVREKLVYAFCGERWDVCW